VRNILAICSRDVRSMFVSPVAYVLLTGYTLLTGWFFFNMLGQFNRLVAQYSMMPGMDTTWLNLNDAVIVPLLQNMSVVLLIVIPMVTMRSFAEERAGGTYELLFTSPLRTSDMVLGKYLAGVVMLSLMMGLSLVFPSVLMVFGNPETGLIASGYLGLFLMGVSFVAIGNFTSALTSNQIIAAVSSLVILLLLFVLNWPAEGASGAAREILLYLAVTEHFQNLVQGTLDTSDLVYFASLICIFLFLTHRAVESARWK
jgi:ABC-2 type transport system permease protein